MYDCKRGSNRGESVVWTDGAYVFSVSSMPFNIYEDKPGGTGYGRAEEFSRQYLKGLGKQIEAE